MLLVLLVWLAPVTGLEPALDLLDGLQLRNVSRQGVSAVPGPQHFRTAFYLQGDYRDLRLPPSSFQRAIDLLRHNTEFTLAASLRQEEANSGTIIAFSHGFNRYLELQSSGRKDEIRLHYTAQYDATIHVEVFPYRLADNMWHKVALSISGAQVELLVDCQILYRRLIRMPDRNFTAPQLALWVGQRNSKHSFFKGAIEEVRIIAGPHGYLKQCPLLDSSCPTCGQFSLLQSTVEQLTQNLYDLSQRLIAAEERISKVESCDCYKSCRVNGSIHADGASWQHDCEICSCVHGDIQCRPVQCPEVNCKNPVREPGKCCPVCRKQCLLKGVMYDDGESVNLRTCVDCQCRNGFMHCVRRDPNITCPPLPCSPQEQFSVPEECCKFCPGVDYCNKGHMCHENATCLNLQTTYACHCNTGFSGDGHLCHDVDECQQEGGLDGHHCHSNTRCVNTPGSYICECLPGYRRLDKFNCVELDECSTGEHGCHSHASCVNTLGSYRCQCQQGYEGDGYDCKPVCNQTCLNGGECIAPGKCQCRQGYVGDYCEQDLDECTTEMHNCHQSSQCVNMPGWYYCRCKSGFRALPHHDSVLGAICQDVDECSEGLHTCHPSAKCVNTEGSFQCSCNESETPDCKLSCMFEGDELMNGGIVTPKGRPCNRCECSDGVVSCHDPVCDCSQRSSRNDKCCPQCDPSAACHHQELRHVVFRSGERWIYQCQTCECLYGEIDCWPMECPPLLCSEPILAPGDCCPRCEDDPCPLDKGDNGSSGQPCTYAGHLFESGSQWQNPHDKCSTCNCKDGRLCCSYDYSCGGSRSNHSTQSTGSTSHSLQLNSVISKVPDENSQTRMASLLSSQAQVRQITQYATSNKTVDKMLSQPGTEMPENKTKHFATSAVSNSCGNGSSCSGDSPMPKTPALPKNSGGGHIDTIPDKTGDSVGQSIESVTEKAVENTSSPQASMDIDNGDHVA